MSKLYNTYLSLKAKETESDKTLFLFKSGIFFIFIDDDAKIVSSLIGLKLTNLTEKIVKCGFPVNSLEKYKAILSNIPYTLKIIDTSKISEYSIQSYSISTNIMNLLHTLSNIDTDNISISQAYDFIDSVKKQAKNILKDNCTLKAVNEVQMQM